MNETKYLKALTDEEMDDLLEKLDFEEQMPPISRFYPELVNRGRDKKFWEQFRIITSNEPIEMFTLERPFSKVYVNRDTRELEIGARTYLTIRMTDFEILEMGIGDFRYEANQHKIAALYNFMINKFGKNWVKDAKVYNQKMRDIKMLEVKFKYDNRNNKIDYQLEQKKFDSMEISEKVL